jgi:hypothetical protein
MEKMTSFTPREMREYTKKNRAELNAAYNAAAPVPLKDDERPIERVARGFAQFRQYINKSGRPKSAERKGMISIRLPEPAIESLRRVDGYSTILGDYIMAGLKSGKIKELSVQ